MRNHPSKIMSDLSQSQTLHTQNHPFSYKTVNKTEADKLKKELTSTQQKQKHLNTSTSSSSKKNQHPHPLLTYGERLYYKNLAKKDLHKLKSKKHLAQLERDFHQTYIFHPTINDYPSSSYKKPKPKAKVLISSQEQKEQNDLNEMHVHKTKPFNKQHISELSERLYNENKQMNLKKENLAKIYHQHECPFMPKIIDLTGMKPSVNNFFMRLQIWFESFNKKLEENYNKQLIDQKNNQKLFTPKIYSNHPGRYDTFEFLFSEYGSLRAKKEQQEKDNVSNCIKLSNTKKISVSSEKMYMDMKKKIIEKLYLLFDYNQTGKIDYNDNVENVLSDLKEKHIPTYTMLSNILQHYKESKEELNQMQFYCTLDWFFDKMDIETKREIFLFTKQYLILTNSNEEQQTILNNNISYNPNNKDKIIEISEVQTPRTDQIVN